MIEELIKRLEEKGMTDARSIVKELVRGGALTAYDASKYLARDKVIVIATKKATSTTCIVGDVAYLYSISETVLKESLRD